jgi:hypothetical protein
MEIVTPILAAIKVIVDSGILGKVGDGAIAKVGENAVDGVGNLSQRLWAMLRRKAPDTDTVKKLGTGKEIDYQQAVIDVEAIADDPDVVKLLDEVRSLLASNQELAAKVEALVTQAQSKNIQVAAKDFEAEELDAEVDQKISSDESKAVNQQTGFDNVKIKGKATIKLNQQIN